MTIELDIQNASQDGSIPKPADFERWVAAALRDRGDTSLTIRIVDSDESADLNRRFRSRSGPTNVLSFEAGVPTEIQCPFLGDIVICAPLVAAEASAQDKSVEAHWAHLSVHGTLHLLGFDHETDAEAAEMEAREIEILAGLGYANPYD